MSDTLFQQRKERTAMTEDRWFAIRTATRQEKRAVESLTEMADQGVVVYMPTETRACRHARQTTSKPYPLMPGYILAKVPERVMWKVARADGVHKIVGTCGRPQPVHPLAVGVLAYFESQREFDLTWAPEPEPWTPGLGDPVAVVRGKYAGHKGTIWELRKNRMTILSSLFGHAWKIDVPRVEVAAVIPEPKVRKAA